MLGRECFYQNTNPFLYSIHKLQNRLSMICYMSSYPGRRYKSYVIYKLIGRNIFSFIEIYVSYYNKTKNVP